MGVDLNSLTVPENPYDEGQEVFDPVNGWEGAGQQVYVAVHRCGPVIISQTGYDPATGSIWFRILSGPGAAWSEWIRPGAPTLASLEPATAELDSPDFTLHCHGSGFTEDSVIVFAEYDEPTVFVSDTEITTGVKPSLGWGEVTVQVVVRNGPQKSAPLDFTFTAPAGEAA